MIADFFSLFMNILCYLGYIFAVYKFCKEYLEISRINEKLFVIFLLAGMVLMGVLSKYCSIPDILFDLLSHIVFMGLELLLFKGDTEKKILIASILITVTTLVENFCASFFSCLALIWAHTVKGIEVPFLDEYESRLIGYITLLMVILAIYRMLKELVYVFYCKTGKWYITLAVPLLAVTTVVDIANWGASNGILVRSGGNMGLYYDQIFSHAEFGTLTLLSMFAAGFYIFGMERIYLEQKKSAQYHFQIEAYEMLEEQYSQSERLRHDLKNHIISLSGLLENKEWENMKDYLRNMEEAAGIGSVEEITGNRVVDVILLQKRKTAERKNITWECDVVIPKMFYINEFDLCVMFGNILDNAIEACERLQSEHCGLQKFINIQAGVVKKCFLLEVKNSTDMTDKSAEYEFGFTDKRINKKADKKNLAEHGIGLLNINDVVNKYNGVMNIEVHNCIFNISVLLPIGNDVHDIKQVI